MTRPNYTRPRRSQPYEKTSDEETDCCSDDMTAPESQQSSPSTQWTGAGLSWQDIILKSFHDRQTHDPTPPQRNGLQHRGSLHDATEKDKTFDDRNDKTLPREGTASMKSAAQVDAETVVRLNEQLNTVTDPFDGEGHAEIVTGLRELIHWHQEQIEVVQRTDFWGMQRQQRMVGRLQALLERAYAQRERVFA